MGHHVKALEFMNQGLSIFTKYYNKDHVRLSLMIRDLGYIYLSRGQIENAIQKFNEALIILEKTKHPERYSCLEYLGQAFHRQSLLESQNGNKKLSMESKIKAVFYFTEALKSAKQQLALDSPHIKRIQSKLDLVEK